ncbi:DUF4397 domain-containing protein [Niastella sp. OAS944]|uniref:DUF4397 domain-containing protein n=1 Tax=Niastella sp. OAS944 TaxID=2664089 RepID=UPI0035C80C50|nr:hypothetical protein [Chitinophagaceae bacterium OAS944]
MRKNSLLFFAIGIAITWFAISCKRELEPSASYETPTGTAYLRIVHAAPYFRNIFNVSDSFNVLVGGTKVTASITGSNPYMTYNSIFPNVSTLNGYISVPAGEQEIKLSAGVLNTDSLTIKRFTKVLAPDTYYTFMITDSINSNRDIAQMFVRDSLTTPTTGYYGLRFIHAVMQDAAIPANRLVDTIDLFSSRYNRNIYTKITPGTITTFSQFSYDAALEDTVYVRRVRSNVNLATLNWKPANQRTYTLYFKGDGTISTTTNPRARSLATIVHK